jgi:hypothetical protein
LFWLACNRILADMVISDEILIHKNLSSYSAVALDDYVEFQTTFGKKLTKENF